MKFRAGDEVEYCGAAMGVYLKTGDIGNVIRVFADGTYTAAFSQQGEPRIRTVDGDCLRRIIHPPSLDITRAKPAENPKTAVGRLKPDLSLIPPSAQLHHADAHMDGAIKYGAFNWRETGVPARTYIAAAMRHLQSYLDGEQVAEDSGVHHLGHAMACCGIIIDAESVGKLVDDRPLPGKASEIIKTINTRRAASIKEKSA